MQGVIKSYDPGSGDGVVLCDTDFMEYDLVHLSHGLLFWGARHIDGRGFDSETNRPTHLQIPLARKA